MEWTIQQLAHPRPPPLNYPSPGPAENTDSKLKGMFCTIHVDEKLFYIKEVKERFFLVKGEAVPVRKTVSKRFIPKVMIYYRVAHPTRYYYTKKCWFDGKLGIWAFAETTLAKKNSKKRITGSTPVVSPLSVTASV